MSEKEKPVELQQQDSRTSSKENENKEESKKNIEDKTEQVADYGGSATDSQK